MTVPVNTREMSMYVGTDDVFSINFRKKLNGDTLTLNTATWDIPAEVSDSDATNSAQVATVRLTSTTPGRYVCKCTAPTVGGGVVVDYIALTVRNTT